MLHLQRSSKISFKHAARASVTVTFIFMTVASCPWRRSRLSTAPELGRSTQKHLWIALRAAFTPSKQFPPLSFFSFLIKNLSWLKRTCAHPWDRSIQAVSLPPASVKNLLRSCQTMTSLRILETGNAALNIRGVTSIRFCVLFPYREDNRLLRLVSSLWRVVNEYTIIIYLFFCFVWRFPICLFFLPTHIYFAADLKT